MDELERARIRVYLNDPEGRGEQLVDTAPPLHVDEGAWAFRVEGPAPEPKPFATDTPEFLYWQLASALDRGKRLWTRRLPSGRWVPGAVLPAAGALTLCATARYDAPHAVMLNGWSGERFRVACTRFRGHRVRCHSGAGGGLWNANAMHESSSLRL